MSKIGRVVAVAMAGVVVSAAAAQDAVQWRVEDGGNGHWYALKDSKSGRWTVHRGLAVASGADLASIGSAEENAFIADLLPVGSPSFVQGPSIGLFQVSGSSEPSGGWGWVDGTPLDYINWYPGEPNNFGSEHWGKLRGSRSNLQWNDVAETSDTTDALATAAIWEWSADCNGDGIVDYGQILDGTFGDDDGDGVPDLCEPVQWRVEDGGNGHWYVAINVVLPWQDARQSAADRGGYLATSTSESENVHIQSHAARFPGRDFWLGAVRPLEAPEPDSGWAWITGETWTWTNWAAGYPDDIQGPCYPDGEPWLEMQTDGSWNDEGYACTPTQTNRFIVEWSADCNGDGIVDYGQIEDGTLGDEDMNGVPDCCEGDCTGDLNLDNTVDSADLGLLIAAWNTDGSIVDGSDINGDRVVNAADLGSLIAAWGQCSGCN